MINNTLVRVVRAFLLLLGLYSAPIILANDKVVHLTSLEWPPYSSNSLPQQGAATAIATAAFASMGYQLKVSFFPWSRAVAFSKENNEYIGYFPEYYSAENAKSFIYSKTFASGPLGFAERKNKSFYWNTLEELAPYQIGVVQDYINTEKLDEMARKKQLKISTTLNDTTNLRKLMSGRVDLAVIDKNVMQYLFKTEWSLVNQRDQVQFNQKILAEKNFYLCFNKSEEGKRMAEIFNQGLAKIDAAAILKQHL